MPLIYDEEIGELVNVCIDCGEGPELLMFAQDAKEHLTRVLPPGEQRVSERDA